MRWSIKLGRWLGINVYVHFTFLLLLVFLGVVYWRTTDSVTAALHGVAFILALFGCVLLHEYGHALMARRYGIATRDITLLPIGGLARLERMPEDPWQEFLVALAGPAVNVVLAALLFIWISLTGGFGGPAEFGLESPSVLQRLMSVNILLVLFNLLPAFPMDGGRVLRALLAARIGRPRATRIAANIGQGMAIFIGIYGFLQGNPFLVFIAIFVYLGAQGEAGAVEMQAALDGLHVEDAMMTRFRTLASTDTLEHAVAELLAGSQQDFPVVDDGQPIGLLPRNALVKALAENRRDTRVADVMRRTTDTALAWAALRPTLETMQGRQVPALPVMRDGRLVGLLTLENISEMIMINNALGGAGPLTRPAT